jgi:hypothetical protein
MNNSKTSILAMIAGSILFGTSFAIGASSDRIEVSADRTSSFTYPKVDEIAPIAPEISTTKPEAKQKSSSVAAMPVVATEQDRVAPISRKLRARIDRRRNVNIPASPVNKVSLDDDLKDRPRRIIVIKKAVADLNDNVSQTAEKQQPKEQETKQIREEIKQIQPEEKITDKSSPEKSAPEKSVKEIKPELPAVEAPKESTAEPPTSPEALE